MSSATSRDGISPKVFKLYAVEVGDWLLGTVQGAFNEKQTVSQIITDAAIGMIPVVGDVTAARDLIAVSSGLIDDPKKREHTMEWVLLVILVFALIPVVGGVIKGVGRLAIKVTGTAIKDTAAIVKAADEIIAFLNRIGHKNAEVWLKSLNVMHYQTEILAKFRNFCDVIILAIYRFGLRFQAVLPSNLIARLESLSEGFRQIRLVGDKMIPLALKELHGKLTELQKMIHAGGGRVPSKAETFLAQTGQKTVTYAEEARLIESGAKKVVHAGKYAQNIASTNAELRHKIAKVYRYETGFPDMLKRTDPQGFFPNIASASGAIKNERISNEILYRSFGPGGSTHGVSVGKSNAIGPYWGVGAPPATATGWRGPAAVLDEWNRNGWLSIIKIPKNIEVKSCTSIVSEQYGKKLTGQFLEGGSKQAYIEEFFEQIFVDATDKLYKKGGGRMTLSNGIVIEVRQSGWKGINGKIGYGEVAIPNSSMVERLAVTEREAKVATQGAQAAAKSSRER
jgi:hypothetical protein